MAVRLKKSSCLDLKGLLVQFFFMWCVPTAVPSDHWLGELYQQLSKMISALGPTKITANNGIIFTKKIFKIFFQNFFKIFFFKVFTKSFFSKFF